MISVRIKLNKVKISDNDLTGQYTLYINLSLCPHYSILWSKTKIYRNGKIDSFYVPNGKIKITISYTHNFIKYFPGADLNVVM